MDKKYRELYESRLEAERRYKTDLEIARDEGIDEGKKRLAMNMLNEGIPVDQVKKISGFSDKAIDEILSALEK